MPRVCGEWKTSPSSFVCSSVDDDTFFPIGWIISPSVVFLRLDAPSDATDEREERRLDLPVDFLSGSPKTKVCRDRGDPCSWKRRDAARWDPRRRRPRRHQRVRFRRRRRRRRPRRRSGCFRRRRRQPPPSVRPITPQFKTPALTRLSRFKSASHHQWLHLYEPPRV